MSEKTIVHYPNLWPRNGVYYIRKRVPTDLVPVLRRSHVARSLRTKDKRTALSRSAIELAALEESFEQQRVARDQQSRVQKHLAAGRLEKLSDRDLEALVHDWFSSLVQAVAQPDGGGWLDWREIKTDLEHGFGTLASHDSDDHADEVRRTVDQILLRAGARPLPDRRRIKSRLGTPAIDRASRQYQALCRLARRAMIVSYRHDLADLEGSPPPNDDPLFRR